MEVDRSAPAVAESSIEVDAEPDVVWRHDRRYRRLARLNPDVKTPSLDGPLAEGTTFKWRAGPATITSILRCVGGQGRSAGPARPWGSPRCTFGGSSRATGGRLRAPPSRGRVGFHGCFAGRCASSSRMGSRRGLRTSGRGRTASRGPVITPNTDPQGTGGSLPNHQGY